MIFRLFVFQEIKKYPFFFLLLFVTLSLGTTGLLGIKLISGEVQERLKQNAKDLLTSDLSVSARRPLRPEEEKGMEQVIARYPHAQYQVIDIYSMLGHEKSGQSRLVEIRATQDPFPFYGKLILKDQNFDNKNFYVSRDLANLWDIQIGDQVQIGELKTAVAGIVEEDSSMGFRGFSLAPRAYLPLELLPKTKLINIGTTGSFAWHFKFKGSAPLNVRSELFAALTDPAVKVTLPEETSEQSGRTIAVIANFMSLSALIGLILALVGVFYLYQSQLLARLRDYALFNLHGVTKTRICLGVLIQFSCVFFFVLLLQLLSLPPLYQLLAPYLSNELGLDLPNRPDLWSLVRLLPILYLLALSILIPLLFGLMRTSMGLQLKAAKLSMGSFRYYDFFPFILLLWLFSWDLSQNLRTGSLFFAGLILVFAASALFIYLVQKILRLLIKRLSLTTPNLVWGLAFRSLSRSGHKLTLSFLSLCLASTLISLILQLDSKIQGELSLSQKRPGLFIFDIQEEQIEDYQKFAQDFGIPLEAVTPMVRARLEEVNGKKFERKENPFAIRSQNNQTEDPRTQNNAVNLTYRAYLTSAEKIIEGSPFPPIAEGQEVALVSVEKRWSQRMGLKLGDKLKFDVQGVEFEAKVHNIKEVKWTSFYPNFFLTVQPGFLELAPKNFLAAFPSEMKEKKAQFQRQTITRFPNISFIDVEELVRKISGLFAKSRQAVEIISWLSLTVGLIILYGLSHDQVYRRTYDLALLKSLGLTARDVRLNLLFEFGSLFAMSASLGFFLGWMLASLIGQEIFRLEWGIDWMRIIYPGLILSVLCLLTILISSWRAVKSKPRELLSDS